MLRPVSAKLCRVGDAQSIIGALGADPCFKIEPKNVIYTLTISPPPFLFNPHLLTLSIQNRNTIVRNNKEKLNLINKNTKMKIKNGLK